MSTTTTTVKRRDLPTIAELAWELKGLKAQIEDGFVEDADDVPHIDFRLYVIPGDGWRLSSGHADYDQDHRGACHADSVSRDTNCRDLAREVIDALIGEEVY